MNTSYISNRGDDFQFPSHICGGGSEIEAVAWLLLGPRNDLLLDWREDGAGVSGTRGTGEPGQRVMHHKQQSNRGKPK